MHTFRLLDLPPMTAAQNMALDQTLLELKGERRSPNTVRLLQFFPPAVLVGFHQCVADEVHIGYCRENGIHINRRISGGGTIYLDPMQLGWEIVCGKSFFDVRIVTNKLLARLCRPVVAALNRLGVPAVFRARNDIEINGRKISGTGGTELYDALFFHGTILVDIDAQRMLHCLNVPLEKLQAREINSIKNRVTSLKQELGVAPEMQTVKDAFIREFEEDLGIRVEPSGLTEEENRVFQNHLPYFESREWIDRIEPASGEKATVRAAHKSPGGMVTFTLTVDRKAKRVKDVCITGDFLSFPARPLYDLEGWIRGGPLDRFRIKAIAEQYLEEGRIHIPGMTPHDFVRPIDLAFDKIERISEENE
jgi:lipoate---protein ligase